MAKKKRSWLSVFKKLFVSDANSGTAKKRRWILGKVRSKRLASLTSTPEKLTQNENVKEKCHSPPQTSVAVRHEHPDTALAAIRIQSALRGFLARKALRALKGLVKLQAIIRGWAVRRQAVYTLKCLQTIVNIQSEFCAKRCDLLMLETQEKDITIDSNSQKRWDDSLLTKDAANTLSSSKMVASIKRERIKEYWLNHRRSTESEQSKLNIKQRYWLEQWVDTQLAKREDLENLETLNSGNAKTKEEVSSRRTRHQKRYQGEAALDSPSANVPRRSFDRRRQLSVGDGGCFGGSSSVPTYMAATESAKAKARSSSSPRQRPLHSDAANSPYKHKLSPISSINSEVTSCSQISRQIVLSQRSPCLKSASGPIKSSRSFNNEQVNANA